MEKTQYNIRFRTNWRGQMIMQVEVDHTSYDNNDCSSHTRKIWRDATVSDFTGTIGSNMNFEKLGS